MSANRSGHTGLQGNTAVVSRRPLVGRPNQGNLCFTIAGMRVKFTYGTKGHQVFEFGNTHVLYTDCLTQWPSLIPTKWMAKLRLQIC